jgi:SAM-dependent methyltransferase
MPCPGSFLALAKRLNMENRKGSYPENRVSAILVKPWAYNLFRMIVGRRHNHVRLVQTYVKPFPGCRILDIGCGPASILPYLPETIGEYTGVDMNPAYIEYAEKRWKDRRHCRFFCRRVEDIEILEKGYYDIVLAIGVLHHLDDEEAILLFDIASQVLKLGGTLITYDNVNVANQHWFARWLISKDRGKAVRTVEGYKRLGAPYFPEMEGEVLNDTLRIPYTILVMKCTKRNSAVRQVISHPLSLQKSGKHDSPSSIK